MLIKPGDYVKILRNHTHGRNPCSIELLRCGDVVQVLDIGGYTIGKEEVFTYLVPSANVSIIYQGNAVTIKNRNYMYLKDVYLLRRVRFIFTDAIKSMLESNQHSFVRSTLIYT